MDLPVETPVTVRCDTIGCPETDITLALAVDNTADVADVRRRAVDAAVANALARGWHVGADGTVRCPLHAYGRVVLL